MAGHSRVSKFSRVSSLIDLRKADAVAELPQRKPNFTPSKKKQNVRKKSLRW